MLNSLVKMTQEVDLTSLLRSKIYHNLEFPPTPNCNLSASNTTIKADNFINCYFKEKFNQHHTQSFSTSLKIQNSATLTRYLNSFRN